MKKRKIAIASIIVVLVLYIILMFGNVKIPTEKYVYTGENKDLKIEYKVKRYWEFTSIIWTDHGEKWYEVDLKVTLKENASNSGSPKKVYLDSSNEFLKSGPRGLVKIEEKSKEYNTWFGARNKEIKDPKETIEINAGLEGNNEIIALKRNK